MERMLRYSYERERVIRMMLMVEDRLSLVNARIVGYDEKEVQFVTTRSPRMQTVRRTDILSVDFRKGDDGQ